MEHSNSLYLAGTLAGRPEANHEVQGEIFYHLTLVVPRLSGALDLLPVTASKRLVDAVPLYTGMPLAIEGQLRAYNKPVEGTGRLLLTAFAQRLYAPHGEGEAPPRNPNLLCLTGALCKPPVHRTTPLGREIADMILAVNRAYGKSDYIPCVVWGKGARLAATLRVGEPLALEGRLQSRPYEKRLPQGTVQQRTAYEVSVARLLTPQTEEANAPQG